MRLVDLDPKWLVRGGRRVGFTFLSPLGQQGATWWRQSCFVEKTSHQTQLELFGGRAEAVQGCRADYAWVVTGGVDAASFDTLTIAPSIDGSAGGLWHGFITNGEIR